MRLISIKAIKKVAEVRGFYVGHTSDSYAEISVPGKSNEDHWHNGCQYVSCDFVLSDGCNTGYGYNPWFYGPFHPGLCRSDSYGVKKLLEHPAMIDAGF